jgi:hypothetical protein
MITWILACAIHVDATSISATVCELASSTAGAMLSSIDEVLEGFAADEQPKQLKPRMGAEEINGLNTISDFLALERFADLIKRMHAAESGSSSLEGFLEGFVWSNRQELLALVKTFENLEDQAPVITAMGEAYLQSIRISPLLKFMSSGMREHVAKTLAVEPTNSAMPRFELTQTFDRDEVEIIANSPMHWTHDRQFMFTQLGHNVLYVHVSTGASMLFKEHHYWTSSVKPGNRILERMSPDVGYFRFLISFTPDLSFKENISTCLGLPNSDNLS